MAFGWLVSLRERRFARRIVKRLLNSHAAVRTSKPELTGTALYREVLLHSGSLEASRIDGWLDEAEDSVDQWTAGARSGLGLREVAHFLVMSCYRDEGNPGSRISFSAVVNALIPKHL